jgi:hypothetical protein
MREKIMPLLSSAEEKQKKLLIITSSGGGGLIQAANAKEQAARAKDPNVVIIRTDVLRDWMGKGFGKFCCNKWNMAQIKGDVSALTWLIWAQFLFDYFCWPNFFFRSLWILFKMDVDEVIDTQPMGTSAFLKAIRIYNKKRGKNLRLEKVLVDLPTKQATHFFYPIKRLGKRDRPFLKLTTIAPLLEEGQTAEDFWQKNCRLSDADINYEDVYVRQSFRKFQNKLKTNDFFPLFIRYKDTEELSFLKKSCKRGSLACEVKEDKIHFSIPPQALLITVLLGSQPASEATFNYMKKFVQLARETNASKIPIYLFVFCAEHQARQMTLFRKVTEYICRMKEYPKNLSVIPFSFQSDDVIASLFYRSDITCTRSGGQTAMELMCVSSGEIWIHSEAQKDLSKTKELSFDQLLEGIPGWEAANACYLQKVCGAKIVTPETISPLARRFFRSRESASGSSRDRESIA